MPQPKKPLPVITLPQKPTYVKMANDIDLYALFVHIERQFENCFLLESLGETGVAARYSVVGFAPEHVVRARGATLFVDDEAYEVENPYQALRQLMPARTVAREYAGGLVGYLGYDAMN
jgi:anthranilate synthase component 1